MDARGRDTQGVWDGHMYTAIFKMDNQQGPTVQHTELYSMLHANMNESEAQGRMESCICMAESLPCSPETNTVLLNGYTQHKLKSLKTEDKKRT